MRSFTGFLVLICLQYWPGILCAQYIPAQYLDEGLNHNLVLAEKKITLEKGLVSLKEARSLFLPTTWFEGQYLLSKGGRSIDIPVGNLLNPVYKTLNELTNTSSFPLVNNVSEQFLPNNFYDARIKTTMPVINPDLRINRDIKSSQNQLQSNEIDQYKRELVKDIKSAYYDYLMAGKAVDIYYNTLEQVVKPNLRNTQSLLKNGKGLPAYVARAESEVKQVESQWQNAVNAQQNARAYFNFLLNRPLTDSILANPILADTVSLSPASFAVGDPGNREELANLNIAEDINRKTARMNNSFRTPRLNAFLDLASQGYGFTVNNKTLFYFAGLDVQVPIFTGRRNLYKIEQTRLDGRSIALRKEDTRKQLDLAVMVSRNNMTTAYSTFSASIKQQESARQYFNLIDKGFKEGVNSFIEFLDARNQWTSAQLQVNINLYKFFSAAADYERQTASYSFK